MPFLAKRLVSDRHRRRGVPCASRAPAAPPPSRLALTSVAGSRRA